MALINSQVVKPKDRRVVGLDLDDHDDSVVKFPVPPPKPTAEQTPHRSAQIVRARESADGNAYRRGDPIPEAEARRQGARIRKPTTAIRIPRTPCPKCRATGQRRMKNHKPDCDCAGCGPCKNCRGTGFIDAPVAVRSRMVEGDEKIPEPER